MRKLTFAPVLGAIAALATTLVLAVSAAPAGADAGPCKRTEFKTKAVKTACAAGGQEAAKADMKKFTSKAKATQSDLTCKSCHTKLGPNYELKADGLERYTKLGGK